MSKKKSMSLADLFNRLINQVKRTMKQSSYKNRNVRRGAPGYRAVRKPAVRNNTRAMPPKLVKPSLSNYLNSPFYRTKTPDQSKLKNRPGTQQEKNNKERPISMRGNKRTGSYNGKFHDIDYSGKIVTRTSAVHDHYNNDTLSKPAAFFKGNLKQTLGGFESALGTIGKNIGGYNGLDASREQQKAFFDEMKDRKNVTKEEVKKAWDESRKKGIAVAEEMKKRGDTSMADHADKLLASGSADLERVKKGKNAVQRTLVDLASSVTQFGIDAGLGALTGGGILPIMAIRSGGTAASEARQEGASDLEQLLYGGGKGTLDVLTEKTMSLVKPLTTVMKKGTLDDYSEGAINKLLKSQIMDKVIKSPEGKNITYHALRAGAAATGEGAEEMLAEALTTPLKNAIYTDGEKIDVKSVLYSGLQGALTGVALGGAGETADYHHGNHLVKNKGFDDKNNVAALIDEGLQSDESTPANKIANQLKNAVESGKKVTPGQILAQKRANQEAIKQESFAIERQKYIAERAAERRGLAPVSVDIDHNHTIIGGATAKRLKEVTGRVSERLMDNHSKDKRAALDTAASISRIAVGLGDVRDFSALLPIAGNETARQIYMEETGSVLPSSNEGTRAVLSKSNMMNGIMMRQEETKFQKGQQKQKIMREAETSLGKNGLSAFSNTLQHSKGKSNSSVMQEFKKYYDGGIANYPVENIYRMSKHDHLPYPVRMAAWQAGYRDSESRMQAEDAGKSDRSARYSINYTNENQPVVILDKDILENVPEENWKSTVRDEMKKFSEGIPVHGKLIKVNAKGRKEFKLNSGSNADEIVWASTDYTNENPKHLGKDDFVDFARGKVLLQSGENKYNASVIIGKRSNGELALYDVVDYKPADFVLKSSKKDADPQFKENNSYRRSYAASSNNSISNSALKNNRNERKQKNSGTFKSQVSLRVVPKKTQDCLKNLAKALNVDIQLDPVLKHDANGFYKDGVIHLSAKTDNPVLSVFKHELTHHIQETAPVEYQKLKEFVMQEYYKGDRKAFQAAIDEKVQAYAKQGQRLTRDQAIDEIIANSAERFLTDEAKIAKVVRQDRSLGQAILDAIRNMIESIKGLMQGRSKELDVLKRAEKLWGDALKVSVESNSYVSTNKTKYQASTATFANEVEKISSFSGTKKDFEYRAIYMGTTPQFLIDMGFPDLPMGMTSKHIYTITNNNGIFNGKNDHYHGLNLETLQRLPDKIENPALTVVSRKGDSIIVFTGEKDPNGLPIMASISYSSKNKFNGVEIVTNFMTSAYGKGENGFRSWVRNAIKNDEVLQFNQKNSQPLRNLLGANYPVLVNYGGFNENIAKFNNNVKNKFPSYDEIAGAKQVVKEQTLDRLDQTLPDTSMAEAYKKGVEKAIDKEQYKKYSLKDHPDEQALTDYESLTEKPDMKVVLLNKADMRNLTRKDIIDAGRKNAEKYGGKDGLNRIYVRNKDLNSDIIIGAPAIRHGLQRDYESNALVAMNLGEYLENAIKVNEIIPRASEAKNGHVLLGYGRTESGVQYPAYFVVQTLTSGKNELIEFESLYSFNGKKIVEAVGSANQGVQSLTSTTISIADLLDIVNETYSDILPKSVAEHFGNKRRQSKLGQSVKYSLKDHPDEQSLINDENQQKRSKYQIKEGMTDRERYEELKDARITPAQYNPEHMAEDIQALTELENTYKSRAEKILKPLAEKFGVFKSYYNESIELEFNYSKGSLNESVFKQATRAGQFDTFAKMLSCFDVIVQNAIPIDIHNDKYQGTMRESGDLRRVYVLVSGYYDNGIIPVQLEIKEFYGNKSNKLYISVTLNKIKKMTIMGQSPTSKSRYNNPMPSFNMSLSELFTNINTSDIDFLKYVPDQFLNKSQMEGKREGLRKEREKLESLKQGVRHSLKDQPDDSAESDLIGMSSVRSHEKKLRNARLKTIEALSLQAEQLRQKKKLTSRKLPDQQNLINQSNNLVRTLLGGKRTKHKLVNIAADNAKAIFEKLKQGDDQEAIEQAYITSREIVESLDLVKDPLYIEYKTLRDYLKTIRVEKQDEPEEHYGMHTLQSGYLKQNEREGLSANRVYKELRRLCPVLFSEDISNPADQLREIEKVRDNLEPYDLMLSGEAAERLINETAASLLEIAYNGTARQIFTDKQKDFLTEDLKLLKQQQKEAKNKVEEKLSAR